MLRQRLIGGAVASEVQVSVRPVECSICQATNLPHR
uniref:Uncharacterized protein n=1 Tax=Acidobacterium capsulatum TaxID=33075 RepID=A0A7V5CUD8_9BACT